MRKFNTRKFSQILTLLLAVCLIGGTFVLTAFAEDATSTLRLSRDGVKAGTTDTNFWNANGFAADKSTKFYNTSSKLDSDVSFYMYGSASYLLPSQGVDGDNKYLIFTHRNDTAAGSGYTRLSPYGGAWSTTVYDGYTLNGQTMVLDFDMTAFDVNGDTVADAPSIQIASALSYDGTGSGKKTSNLNWNLKEYFSATPEEWVHVTVIVKLDGTTICFYLYIDGEFKLEKSITSYSNDSGRAITYFNFNMAEAADMSTSDSPRYKFGFDNYTTHFYSDSYQSVAEDDLTFANLIANPTEPAEPLYMYADLVYYYKNYNAVSNNPPINPNPAVATVDGVEYSSMDEALLNLTDGKTLETALAVENYTPGDVTSVNIKSPTVTLSEAAKAAGFVTATWKNTAGNVIMTTVCKSGTELTPPELELVPIADADNPYRDWCTVGMGYSSDTIVVTEDTVVTPDKIIPIEAKVKGIWYNANIDSSFDIVVYSPIHYMKDENGEFVKVNPEVEGVVFTGMGGNKDDDFDGEYVQIGTNLYAKAIYRSISMRKTHDSFTPVFNFTVNGVEMSYSFEITITSYAEAVWAKNPCGSEAATLVTAMMNYAESFRYHTSNKNATTATVREGGAHYDCDCQKALAAYAENPYAEEMTKLTEGEDYNCGDYINGFTMHVLINEPAIALIFENSKIGDITETAGQNLVNAIRYTYTDYTGKTVTQTNLFKGATTGGWTEYYNNGETVFAKPTDIYVVDLLAPVTIELLTCTELNASNHMKSTFEILDTVTYSVAEYYEYLSSEKAATELSETDIERHKNSLEALYVLSQASIAYRTN